MKIEKAIEELNTLNLPLKTEQDHNKHLAVRLGIEALKFCQQMTKGPYHIRTTLLPGETEE